MQLSLCNEMLADEGYDLDEQCVIAKALGYCGLELAMGSLAPQPHTLSADDILAIRRTVENHGLHITGLHWLLAPYPTASILDRDQAHYTQTILLALVEQCAALGGRVLVHGSPSARRLSADQSLDQAADHAALLFAPIAKRAEDLGVTYCIEPLSHAETSFVTTVSQAKDLVDKVDNLAFQTMIDTSAAGQTETVPVADLLLQWIPTGAIAHIQVNDTNRGAPGCGADPFADIVLALRRTGWKHPIAIEPFKATYNALATAAIGAATMRAYWDACTP